MARLKNPTKKYGLSSEFITARIEFLSHELKLTMEKGSILLPLLFRFMMNHIVPTKTKKLASILCNHLPARSAA
jgi:hypothetical protein